MQTDARPTGIISESPSASPLQASITITTATTTETQTTVQPAMVATASAPVTRQLAPQKVVELAMTTPAAGGGATVTAKVSETKKRGGFSFAVKEAVDITK